MCLSDTVVETPSWPPRCPQCGKQKIVIGGTPDFPGENYASTMGLVCPDWPDKCDMRDPTPRPPAPPA